MLASLLTMPAMDARAQSQGIVVKQSAFGVSETLDRLERVFEQKGFEVFARIDHSERAQGIKKNLAPAEALIFGNPRVATPLMQDNPVAGVDLPMQALAYRAKDGKVFLVYDHPAYIARRHGINAGSKLIKAVSRILTRLTDQAVKKQ